LQRLQGLVDARGLLTPTALAVDGQLLGQPVGDHRSILVGNNCRNEGIPQHGQGSFLGGIHHRLQRLRQGLLLLYPCFQRARPGLARL